MDVTAVDDTYVDRDSPDYILDLIEARSPYSKDGDPDSAYRLTVPQLKVTGTPTYDILYKYYTEGPGQTKSIRQIPVQIRARIRDFRKNENLKRRES